jgi:hypothetical protein
MVQTARVQYGRLWYRAIELPAPRFFRECALELDNARAETAALKFPGTTEEAEQAAVYLDEYGDSLLRVAEWERKSGKGSLVELECLQLEAAADRFQRAAGLARLVMVRRG